MVGLQIIEPRSWVSNPSRTSVLVKCSLLFLFHFISFRLDFVSVVALIAVSRSAPPKQEYKIGRDGRNYAPRYTTNEEANIGESSQNS